MDIADPAADAAADPPPAARAGVWAGSVAGRLGLLWAVAVLGWATFAGFRAGLLIYSARELGGVGSGDIAKCLAIGLWYDAMPMGYVLLPLVLALLLPPAGWFARRWFVRCVTGYAAVVVMGLFAVEVIGAAFYLAFGTRLNWLALDHVGHFSEPAKYIFKAYPVWLFVAAVPVAMGLTYVMFRRRYWRRSARIGGARARVAAAALLCGLAALGCRGSFRRPLRFGPCYFADNKVLAQLTLNNVFTLAHAVRTITHDNLNEAEMYAFPPPVEAAAETVEILARPGDTFLGSARNPMWRRTDTGRPRLDYNVVLILMEGMAGEPVGALSLGPTQTPCFDALCDQGLFFERMYGVGNRTSRGMTAALCGHPDLGGPSLLKRVRSQGNCLTLPGIFRRRGYRTMFIYGGDPDFDNMKKFFEAGGIQEFICHKSMTAPPELENDWGYHDEVILRKAHETFLGMGRERFFAVVLTVSNHRPFDVPAGRVDLVAGEDEPRRRINGYRYADWALGEFFRLASGVAYFRNTIFVLVADHAQTFDGSMLFDLPGYRVPCLIYAPGLVPSGRVRAVTSQTDIPPTILALLGGSYEHCFLGRDARHVAPGEGFALVHDDDRLAVVRGRRALVLPSEAPPMLFDIDPAAMSRVPDDPANAVEVERLRRQLLSYYGLGLRLYHTCSYQDPARAPRVPPRR